MMKKLKFIIFFFTLLFGGTILKAQTFNEVIPLGEIDISEACDPKFIFVHLNQMPSYEGGLKKLKSELSSKIQYPKDYTGSLYIRFIVNCEGRAVGFRCFNGKYEETDLRLIEELSKLQNWQSGTQNENAVDCYNIFRIRVIRGKIKVE